MKQVTDGTGSTYLIGEKWLSDEGYDGANPPGDSQSMYVGHDEDTARYGGPNFPLRPDWSDEPADQSFGGPHEWH